jgi:hypothetical protein
MDIKIFTLKKNWININPKQYNPQQFEKKNKFDKIYFNNINNIYNINIKKL